MDLLPSPLRSIGTLLLMEWGFYSQRSALEDKSTALSAPPMSLPSRGSLLSLYVPRSSLQFSLIFLYFSFHLADAKHAEVSPQASLDPVLPSGKWNLTANY